MLRKKALCRRNVAKSESWISISADGSAWTQSSIKTDIVGWNRLKIPSGEPCTSPDSWMCDFWAGESWSSACVWMVCWLLIARIARRSNFKLIDVHISNSKHSEIAKLRERVISTLELVQRVVLLPSIDQPRREELINSRISQGSGLLVETGI